MALPNIYLWMGERGWTHVYPDEIRAPQFQHGISANDRLLLCRTCGQHVGYVAEFYRIDGARVSSFFRHAPGTVCDDIHYTHEPTPPPPPAPNPEAQDIPVYLSISGESFNWEVKLPQLPDGNASGVANALFEISFEDPISDSFRFQFSRSGGVRFAVGANPPETCSYSIRKQTATGWTDAFLAPKSWRIAGGQGSVRLFQEGGLAAFSDNTGRLLPVSADVGVGRWVRIATKTHFGSCADVETIRLAQKGAWKVYRARAKKLHAECRRLVSQVRIELDCRADAVSSRMASVRCHPDASDSQKSENVLFPSRCPECRPSLAQCRLGFTVRTRFSQRQRDRDTCERSDGSDVLHPCRRPLGHPVAK